MNRRPGRIALVLLTATLAACVVNLSYTMSKTVPVQSAGAGSISQSIAVNLADYKEVTDHKDNIKSLDLDYADVTVASVGPSNTAQTLNGAVRLKQNLTDTADQAVLVGQVSNFVIAQGTTRRLVGSPVLDAFLLNQLHQSGTFYVIVDGTVDGRADVVLSIDLHASMGYETGLF